MNTSMNSKATHTPLSSEQLDALLTQPDVAPADLAQHPELAALRSVLDDLRVSSAAVADHHRYQARHVLASRSIGGIAATWGALATAALICAVAIPLALHHHPSPVAGPITASISKVVTISNPPTAAEPVSDEALLADVQADLNDSIPSAMLPLADSTESTSTPQRNR